MAKHKHLTNAPKLFAAMAVSTVGAEADPTPMTPRRPAAASKFAKDESNRHSQNLSFVAIAASKITIILTGGLVVLVRSYT